MPLSVNDPYKLVSAAPSANSIWMTLAKSTSLIEKPFKPLELTGTVSAALGG